MLLQRLQLSCKYLSIGFGLVTSYFAYQYQNVSGLKIERTLNQNIDEMQKWLKLKSHKAVSATEKYLLQCCETFSTSQIFHQADMTLFLIYLANSKKPFLHDLGVKLLAVVQFPNDIDLKYYVERCDYSALVGLARTESVTLKWFLNDSLVEDSLDDDERLKSLKEKIDVVLKDIQAQMPENEKNCSTWLYEKVAFKKLPPDPMPNLMSDFCTERDTLSYTSEKPNRFHKNLPTYLDILRRYSTDPMVAFNHALSCDVVKVLKEVLLLYPTNHKVSVLCGIVLGNLAMNERNRKAIVESGFLPTLVQWKHGDLVYFSIVANRVLYNLDGKYNGNRLLQDGLYQLHPQNRTLCQPKIDVVFVHGINGSPFHTWRQNDASQIEANYTRCWPKDWLPNDAPDSRVICVQYESSLSDWLLSCPIEKEKYSLDKQAEEIKKKLLAFGVGSQPVLWVCHSMGGVITKKLLLSAANFIQGESEAILHHTKGVIFYSVPHLGSPAASQSEKARYILFPSIEVHELSGHGNKLQELHANFAKLLLQFDIDCLDFGESKPLVLPFLKIKTMVVPDTSCNVGYGRFISLPDANHQETCKPISRSDQRYTEVVQFINKILQK